MNADDADRFLPEHLARWLKLTREYLVGPIGLLSAGTNPEIVEKISSHPASQVGGTRPVQLSWAYRALLHLLRRATQHEENPLTALENAFYFHVSFMAKHPSVPMMILAWYSQTKDARVRSRIQGAIGDYESRLARLIGKAKRLGLVRSTIDAKSAASVFVGMIQGLALRMSADLSRPEMLLREAATAFPVYLDGIRTPPASVRGAFFN